MADAFDGWRVQRGGGSFSRHGHYDYGYQNQSLEYLEYPEMRRIIVEVLQPASLLLHVQTLALEVESESGWQWLVIASLGVHSMGDVLLVLRASEVAVGRCIRGEVLLSFLNTVLLGAAFALALPTNHNHHIPLLLAVTAAMSLTLAVSKASDLAWRVYRHTASVSLSAIYAEIPSDTRQDTPPLGYLSAEERRLIIAALASVIYITLGGVLFAQIEKWPSANDGIYFVISTILSIGLGDLAPKTILARAILPAYTIMGAVLVGFFVFAVRSLCLAFFADRIYSYFETPDSPEDLEPLLFSRAPFPRSSLSRNSFTSTSSSFTAAPNRKLMRSATTSILETPHYAALALPPDSPMERASAHLKSQLILSTALLILVLGLFSFLISHVENWTIWEALYFTFVSFSTIGYGDYYCSTTLGKTLFIWFILLGVGLVGWLASTLSEFLGGWWEARVAGIKRRVTKRRLTRTLSSSPERIRIRNRIGEDNDDGNSSPDSPRVFDNEVDDGTITFPSD